MWVLDPLTRKLRVPMRYLVPTQATQTQGTVPSLCIAFLENRCHHAWCRQAHVLPHMIHKLRHDALHAPTCCVSHGDPHDLSCLTSRFSTVTITDSCNAEPFPTSGVALTVGLQRHLAQSVPAKVEGGNLELSSRLICRLHLAQRCRYLEDCNNIHVCRKLDLRLHPPPHMVSPLTSLLPNATSVCIGDTNYSIQFLAGPEISEEDFKRLLRRRRQKDTRKHQRIVNRMERQQAKHEAALVGRGGVSGAASSHASDTPLGAGGGGGEGGCGASASPSVEEPWETGSVESMSSSPFSSSLSSFCSGSDDDVIYLYEKLREPPPLEGIYHRGSSHATTTDGMFGGDLGDSFTVESGHHNHHHHNDLGSSASGSPHLFYHAATSSGTHLVGTTMQDRSPYTGGTSSQPASVHSTPMIAPHTMEGGHGVSPLHTFHISPPLYAAETVNPPNNSTSLLDPRLSPGCDPYPDPYPTPSASGGMLPTAAVAPASVVPQSLPQPPYTRVYDVRQVTKEKGSPTPFSSVHQSRASPALSTTGSPFSNSPELSGIVPPAATNNSKGTNAQHAAAASRSATNQSTPTSTPPYAVPKRQGGGGSNSPAPDPTNAAPTRPPPYSPLALPSAAEGGYADPHDEFYGCGHPSDMPLELGDGVQTLLSNSIKDTRGASSIHVPGGGKSSYASAVASAGRSTTNVTSSKKAALGGAPPSIIGGKLSYAATTTKVTTPAKIPRPAAHSCVSDEGVSTLPDGAGWKVMPLE